MATILRLYFVFFAIFLFYNGNANAEIKNPTITPIIRNISIEVRDVFDEPELDFIYRAANSLKTSTREKIVKRELLFHEGDQFDKFLLEESVRNLRALPFLREIEIIPKFEGNFVDIFVRVQDVWTLYPQASFSSGTGTQKSSFSLVETNLLGYGKRLELLYADDEGREKIEGVYDDQRVLGSRNRFLIGRFERSDGYRNVAFLSRPYRSFSDKSAWGVATDFSNTIERLFKDGDTRYIFRQRHHNLELFYSRAIGDPEKDIKRYTAGYEFNEDKFWYATPGDYNDIDIDPDDVEHDPSLLANDRRFSGPFMELLYTEPDYISLNYLDRFERVQDFNLGFQFDNKLTLAPEIFGSDEDTLIGSATIGNGRRFAKKHFIRGELGATTRTYRLDGFENTLIRGELKYYDILGVLKPAGIFIGHHTIAGAFFFDYGTDLDKEREFVLGASNGLRGYKDRAMVGGQRLILNLEDRAHFVDQVFKIVSIGSVAFIDIGGTSNEGPFDILSDELRGNIGAGLRFGFPRSSGGGIFRIDVAFPWRDGPDGTDAWEPRLIVSTGQLFGGNLRSESLGPGRANVSIGLSD